jgi:hypothetical protein
MSSGEERLTMSKRAQYEIPAAMREAQQRFDEWRSSHSGRQPIPESLWALAAELAGQHGVFRTAQVLRLDYNKLKRQAPATKPTSAPQPTFIELIAQSAAKGCECTIEVEGPRGRMLIEWKGATPPDLAGLSRMLWEPGA